MGNGYTGNITCRRRMHRQVFPLIRLDIYTGMEMIGPAFREAARQGDRDIQGIAEITPWQSIVLRRNQQGAKIKEQEADIFHCRKSHWILFPKIEKLL